MRVARCHSPLGATSSNPSILGVILEVKRTSRSRLASELRVITLERGATRCGRGSKYRPADRAAVHGQGDSGRCCEGSPESPPRGRRASSG